MALTIMVQGTASSVGKSLVVCGLCRALARRGLSVAPFKSQNMALNSFVTADKKEMGRAQVSQALAAYKEPNVLMNPVLLKPTSDVGSQVIVLGKAIGTMRAREYQTRKKKLLPLVVDAYEQLAAENDVVVIEGAGSPAEINLREDDIVNMGLACALDIPVVVVGDIDRGGVFAALYGTLALLQPEERERVLGVIINKFRGDVSLLEPGLREIEKIADTRVLGVIPYTPVDIDDEDSLSSRLTNHTVPEKGAAGSAIDIAVVKVGKLSNFSDFTSFGRYEGVCVRYVTSPQEIEGAAKPDLIILPGSKSTLPDLRQLKASGMAAALQEYAHSGGLLIGVCGGFQMLGDVVQDSGVETEGYQEESGLGLLPLTTTLAPEKTLAQFEGRTAVLHGDAAYLSKLPVKGYEIHNGITCLSSGVDHQSADVLNLFEDGLTPDMPLLGAVNKNGNVVGTYIHGLFDTDEIVDAVLSAAAPHIRVQLKPDAETSYAAYVDKQFDTLADVIEDSLDVDELLDLMKRWDDAHGK